MKKTREILKVGYSIYDVKTLEALLDKGGMIPDIIQLPYTIFLIENLMITLIY